MASIFPDSRRDQFLEKPLPSNDEGERLILGAILLDNAVVATVIEHLKPEDFYSPFNRRVFGAMVSLFEKQSKIEPILIGEELKKEGALDAVGGITAITNLSFGVPHYIDIEPYIKIVRDKAIVRNLIRTCNSITSNALAEDEDAEIVIDRAEQQIFALAESRTQQSLAHAGSIAGNVLEQIKEHAAKGDQGLRGLTTGFAELDNLTSGLQRTDLIIIAARPSMGKTALCLNIAQNAAVKSNAVVAVFSLEMSKEQLVTRMLSSEARVNAARLRTGHIMKAEWERMAHAIDTISRTKLFIDDTPGISTLEIRAKVRRLAAEQKGLDLILVDYLQLMGGSRRTESRQQEVSAISRELKALAKEMNVPVMALSQLSRAPEARSPPRPVMSDLRESGSIEQDADVVGFIFREDYYNQTDENQGLAELIIAKQRNGPTGSVKLAFLKEFTKFENYFEG
jgi:replicative DNA helicase